MALPTTQDLEVIKSFSLVHFKEGHRVRNGALELLDMLQEGKATRGWLPYRSLLESDPIGSQAHEEPLLTRAIALGCGL